jgi:hypothetical protein
MLGSLFLGWTSNLGEGREGVPKTVEQEKGGRIVPLAIPLHPMPLNCGRIILFYLTGRLNGKKINGIKIIC